MTRRGCGGSALLRAAGGGIRHGAGDEQTQRSARFSSRGARAAALARRGHIAHRRVGPFGRTPRAACRCRAAQDTAPAFDRLRGRKRGKPHGGRPARAARRGREPAVRARMAAARPRVRLPRLGAAAHRLAVQPCRRKSADPGRDGRRPDAANAPARRAARRGDGHFARRPL